MAVAHDLHRRLEAGQGEGALKLRQRLAQPGIARSGGKRDKKGKHQKYANYYFHRVNLPSRWPLMKIG